MVAFLAPIAVWFGGKTVIDAAIPEHQIPAWFEQRRWYVEEPAGSGKYREVMRYDEFLELQKAGRNLVDQPYGSSVQFPTEAQWKAETDLRDAKAVLAEQTSVWSLPTDQTPTPSGTMQAAAAAAASGSMMWLWLALGIGAVAAGAFVLARERS
jgi:hypothetical protein